MSGSTDLAGNLEPAKDVTLQFAVYNGDPAGPGQGDEQLRNRYGLNFRVQDPPFVMAEAQSWAAAQGCENRYAAVVQGFGLGYHIEHILKLKQLP